MTFQEFSNCLEKCRHSSKKKIGLFLLSLFISFLVFRNAHHWINEHCVNSIKILASCNNKSNFIRSYVAPFLALFILPILVYSDKIWLALCHFYENKFTSFLFQLDSFIENLTSRKKWFLSFLFSLFVMIVIFYSQFSFVPLNPSNNLWLQNKSDWNQSYLGWFVFLNSPWEHAYSMLKNIYYPHEISVGYSEPMVFFAFIFKLFKNILPETFQFQGPWLFSSYILQPLFASLIVKDWHTKFLFKVLSTLLISCAPILFFRYFHLPLCAHWLILACFYLYMTEDFNAKKKLFFQTLLLVFSAGIHPYLVVILSALNCAFLLNFYLTKQFKLKTLSLVFLVQQIFILSIWYFTGYFAFGGGSDLHRNVLTTNLNGFFNSASILSENPASNLLAPLAAGKFQYEGFAYLGFGIILAFFLVLFEKGKEKSCLFYNKNKSLILFVGVLYFLSLGNEIWFGSVRVLNYSFPHFIEQVLLPFQSCGRFVWPACYLVTIFTFYKLCLLDRSNRKKTVLFLFLTVIQLIDIQPLIKSLNLENGSGFKTENIHSWLKFMGNNHTKILFYPPYQDHYNSPSEYTNFWYMVGKYHFVTNMGYIARRNDAWNRDAAPMLKRMENSNFEAGAIYVTQLKNKELFKKGIRRRKVICTTINHFYVCKQK